jgi:antitoxin ParD1/3/4
MENMNVSLTPELEEYIEQKIETGRYHSASEVVREALRLLEEHDQLRQIRLKELRKDIQVGLESGKSIPLDIEEIKKEGRKRLSQSKKKSG